MMKNFLFNLAFLIPFFMLGYIIYKMANSPDPRPWTDEEKAAARHAQVYPIVYWTISSPSSAINQ